VRSIPFASKQLQQDHLALVVGKALEHQKPNGGVEIASEEIEERHRLIVGESAEMKQAVDLAKKAAGSNATVLLLGESGTGKEIFARAIHNWSERKNRPFIAINSVGLSKELLESELFGHEQGAFTGAQRRKTGKIELAHSGTIFFDEIGDVSQELQTKLLRFLQEREFERVGGVMPISVDVRIIAATNRNLERSVKEGRFREDLYYRLNVVAIHLPPLRERREDITPLTQYFLRKHSVAAEKNITEISKEAQARLAAYDWPGNVRELANVIERALVLGSGPTVTVEDLPDRIAYGWTTPTSATQTYREGLDAARKELIKKALATTRGNRSAAAKILGLEAKYLFKLIKSLRIE
jgi:transcriptional regulator with PAS, ATPase and Fis domain